ncbi:MAG: hypothetical protein ABI891_15475 [Acidobacteriota bacterium]
MLIKRGDVVRVLFGLRLDSVIMTDNLIIVLDSEIDSILGSLLKMEKVESALCHTLGIKLLNKEN